MAAAAAAGGQRGGTESLDFSEHLHPSDSWPGVREESPALQQAETNGLGDVLIDNEAGGDKTGASIGHWKAAGGDGVRKQRPLDSAGGEHEGVVQVQPGMHRHLMGGQVPKARRGTETSEQHM
jgi:hypothetical protein